MRRIYRRSAVRLSSAASASPSAQARLRAADTEGMRRALALTSTILVCARLPRARSAAARPPPSIVAPAAPAPASRASWADAQIRVVTAVAILGRRSGDVQARSTPSRGASWPTRSRPGESLLPVPADPARLVTMRELDAQLVGALGLLPAARRIRIAARDAGLTPTSMLGTETVARLLGLRLNHPQGSDELELLPSQPATRAEAAYSLARALKLTPGQVAWLDQLSQTFSLPELDDWQRAVLGRALRFVGYPYVWAGTSETTPEALERNRARRLRHGSRRLRLLGVRVARLQDEAVRRSAAARRHPQAAGRPTP